MKNCNIYERINNRKIATDLQHIYVIQCWVIQLFKMSVQKIIDSMVIVIPMKLFSVSTFAIRLKQQQVTLKRRSALTNSSLFKFTRLQFPNSQSNFSLTFLVCTFSKYNWHTTVSIASAKYKNSKLWRIVTSVYTKHFIVVSLIVFG